MASALHLNLRRAALAHDAQGCAYWRVETRPHTVQATAIVVCDMWDNHWSRGAALRVDALAPRMNAVLHAARNRGVHIIHAPSDTLAYYADSPARLRILQVPAVEPPAPLEIPAPRLPIDDSDHGSDTGETETFRAWTRQHPAIDIDETRDAVSDQGREIYAWLRHHGVEQVLIMGVHTNMCILNRSFGIKQMVKWQVPIALVRDLTDTMYNPAAAPYVDHDEGTRLVVGYIERFWCPTVDSGDLMT